LNKLLFLAFCVYLFIILITGCISDKEVSNKDEDKEVDYDEELSIEYFIVKPGLINIGYSANLTWKVMGATNVSIDNNIGTVGLEGWQIILPKVDTTYTLTASNFDDEIDASTTIFVIEDNNELTPSLSMTKDLNSNSCIITISTITEIGVLWSDTKYTLIDLDKMSLIPSDVTYPSSGIIKNGDIIIIKNLDEFHEYRFTITFIPTDFTMGVISWIQ